MPSSVGEQDDATPPSRTPSRFGNVTYDSRELAKRAAPPRPPALPKGILEREKEREAGILVREASERRSSLRGLVLLAVLAFALSCIYAGLNRAFAAGWWQRW